MIDTFEVFAEGGNVFHIINNTIMHQRDFAGLFGDYEAVIAGALIDTESSAMASTVFPSQFGSCQRKHYASRSDATFGIDDDGAVVQSRLGKEDRQEQLSADISVDFGAGFYEGVVQLVFCLQHYESTDVSVAKSLTGSDKGAHYFFVSSIVAGGEEATD